jgi:ABC-type multidrug transport system fused ATPase/permease subunit
MQRSQAKEKRPPRNCYTVVVLDYRAPQPLNDFPAYAGCHGSAPEHPGSRLLTSIAWVQETVVQRSGAEAARRLLGSYLAAPYVFHLRRNSATLIQAASQSVDAAFSSGLVSAVNIAIGALTVVGLIAVLSFAAPLVTLVSVASIGIVLIGPLFVTRRLAVRYGAETKLLQEALLQDLQQSLASFKEVRVMGAQRHFLSAFSTHRELLAAVRKRQATMTTAMRVFVESTFVVAVLMAVVLLMARGDSGGSLIGLLAMYAYVCRRALGVASRTSHRIRRLAPSRTRCAPRRAGRPIVRRRCEGAIGSCISTVAASPEKGPTTICCAAMRHSAAWFRPVSVDAALHASIRSELPVMRSLADSCLSLIGTSLAALPRPKGGMPL